MKLSARNDKENAKDEIATGSYGTFAKTGKNGMTKKM